MRKLKRSTYVIHGLNEDGTFVDGVYGTLDMAQAELKKAAAYYNDQWSVNMEQLSDELFYDPQYGTEVRITESPMFR